MYAQLTYKVNSPNAPWELSYAMCTELAMPDIPLPEAVARGNLLKLMKNDPGNKITDSLMKELSPICRGLPANVEALEFNLYMALAHLQLPEAQRKERQARIDQTMNAHFLDLPVAASGKVNIQYIKMMAQLVPDALLEGVVRTMAARLQLFSMHEPDWALCLPQLMNGLDAAELLDGGLQTQETLLRTNTLFLLPLAERSGYVELVKKATAHKYDKVVSLVCDQLKETDLIMASRADFLIDVLKECESATQTTSKPLDLDQIVSIQMELCRNTRDMQKQAILTATIDAINKGTPFGPEARDKNKAALAASRQVRSSQFLLMTPQRLRLRAKLLAGKAAGNSKNAPSTSDPSSTTDLDPVYAWSVNRLLRWIQGPISDATPKPLDRKSIVLQEKADCQEARAQNKSPAPSASAELDLTEEDVDLAIQNALSTSAEFSIGEIQDLQLRLKALNIELPAGNRCGALLESLGELVRQPASDDQKARLLLYRADGAIKELRQSIRAKELDARTQARFAHHLRLALSREAMVEGKRHGGLIDCPMRGRDWPWVAEQYHRRWLPWIKEIVVDGVSVPLADDQALGLYVTAKSLSGFEFDVSVHLWQRKPGCAGAPGTGLAPFSPMNTQDWIDTLTPCCVLHVPTA